MELRNVDFLSPLLQSPSFPPTMLTTVQLLFLYKLLLKIKDGLSYEWYFSDRPSLQSISHGVIMTTCSAGKWSQTQLKFRNLSFLKN